MVFVIVFFEPGGPHVEPPENGKKRCRRLLKKCSGKWKLVPSETGKGKFRRQASYLKRPKTHEKKGGLED